VTIEFTGDVHEFSFNTAYFTVTPLEFYFVSETEKEILWWKDQWLPNQVRKELLKMGGGIIWWRVKPELDHAKIGCDAERDPRSWTDEEKRLGENYFCWKGYARFGTSPPLPEDVVTRLTDSYDEFREKWRKLREQALTALMHAA